MPKTYSSVEEEGVVAPPWALCRRNRSSVSKLVGPAHYEGGEDILWVQLHAIRALRCSSVGMVLVEVRGLCVRCHGTCGGQRSVYI